MELTKKLEQSSSVPVFFSLPVRSSSGYEVFCSPLLETAQMSRMSRCTTTAGVDPVGTHTGDYMRKLHICETPGNNNLDLNT